MVQRSRTTAIILQILGRLGLTLLALVAGLFFFPTTIHDFVMNTLLYQLPSGFFGFTATDWFLTWEIASTLLIGIALGSFGKKIDYILIIGFFVFFSYDFLSAENMTLLVYSGLVGATLLGNTIGFILKLLRQKYLPRLSPRRGLTSAGLPR